MNITLQNKRLTVRINTLGAEIQSILCGEGRERIWQGKPGIWSKHAPLLFPVAGALKGDQYRLDGRAYPMGRHGFAREREFTVSRALESEAILTLTGANAYHTGFPIRYTLHARYALSDNRLTAQTIVINEDAQPLWYSAGAHEAYACPGGVYAHELVFEKAETPTRCIPAGGLLTGKEEPLPLDGRTLSFTPEHFAHDTLVLKDLSSRSVTLQSPHHEGRVTVDYPDFPYLLLWTQPGGDYLCIEPWHNLPDRADSDQDITKKPGMINVMPGEESTLTHTMTFA